jgi:hypothetical protein
MVELSRQLITARDVNETVYAIEVIEADRWDEAFLHHDREEADVRVVRLQGGEPPDLLPAWLAVEMLPRHVAEATAAYATAPAAASLAATLWSRSPAHRGPGASLDEFMGAGADALRYPSLTPVNRSRRQLIVRNFVAGRGDPLHAVAELEGDLLERALRIVFETPQRFAEQLAIERIAADGAREVSEVLHFLGAAEVASGPEFGELAIDRRVLREQASPWRYLDGKPFTSALAAAQAWQRRYRVAYESHYRSVISGADELRARLEHASQAAIALERLNAIRALGPPAGVSALFAFTRARDALAALPAEADGEAPITAGVGLGGEPSVFAQVEDAAEQVAQALELQRGRLASQTVRFVLERESVPSLDRLLQAITASDLGGIERALDDRLARHIDRLLTAAATSPLSEFVERYAIVSEATIDEAVAAFRALLEAAIRGSVDGHAILRARHATAVA